MDIWRFFHFILSFTSNSNANLTTMILNHIPTLKEIKSPQIINWMPENCVFVLSN